MATSSAQAKMPSTIPTMPPAVSSSWTWIIGSVFTVGAVCTRTPRASPSAACTDEALVPIASTAFCITAIASVWLAEVYTKSILTDAEGQATAHVPIAVLAKGDLRLRLRDVLGQLNERDSVLPDQPSTPKVPLVLLSGFSTVATSATVRAVRALGLTGGQSGEERPMFAVAVPNALDKPLSVLIDEISGDHLANRQAAPDA